MNGIYDLKTVYPINVFYENIFSLSLSLFLSGIYDFKTVYPINVFYEYIIQFVVEFVILAHIDIAQSALQAIFYA